MLSPGRPGLRLEEVQLLRALGFDGFDMRGEGERWVEGDAKNFGSFIQGEGGVPAVDCWVGLKLLVPGGEEGD